MNATDPWLAWAVELQALAQAGLHYGKDRFDLERYERIREIAAELVARQGDIPLEKAKDLFCCETGYQTPKLDTRAAVFRGEEILLVRERDGRWAIPGGWCEYNLSPADNAVKELKEEAGVDAAVRSLIAVQDRDKHNRPICAYKICKIFVRCTATGGQFTPNSETTESRYFGLDELPPLSEEKTTAEQIRMCFDACRAGHWEPLFD